MENAATYFMKEHVRIIYYILTLSNEELFLSVIYIRFLANSDW
jgi:hypothetical protein